MENRPKSRSERVAARKTSQDANLFSRLPAAATASRGQAQRLLTSCSALSVTEWRMLWDLVEAGPLSVQDMATIQRTDHSLISRTLSAMRTKQLVTTDLNKDDKRQSLVTLTPEGQRAFDAAAPVMKHRRAALSKAFPDGDLEHFIELLNRFEAFLDDSIEKIPAKKMPVKANRPV